MERVRVALAQINTTIGDLEGNARKVAEYVERARAPAADIVSFPELTVTGYPPEDLLLRPAFIRDSLDALKRLIVRACTGVTAVVGFVDEEDGDIYNAAAVIHDGVLKDVYRKQRLPNYGVFDEMRYFRAARECPVYHVAGTEGGVNICEDIWFAGDPTEAQALGGARVSI